MPGKQCTASIDLEIDDSTIVVKQRNSDRQGLIDVLYHGSICSAKEFRLRSSADRMHTKEKLMNACQQWVQLQHPQIVRLIGIYKPQAIFPNVPLLVMEKTDCHLQSLLSDHHEIPIEVKLSILLDVSLGLKFLHSQKTPLVHGDLTAKTILLTPQLQAKICGIEGVQVVKVAKSKAAVKSAVKLAVKSAAASTKPSSKKPLGLPADIFSYGLVILHTATHQEPEHGIHKGSGGVERYLSCMRGDTKCLEHLMESCMHANAEKRPTIDVVLKEVEVMAGKMPWSGRNSTPLILQAEHSKQVCRKEYL